jgi:putative transposase
MQLVAGRVAQEFNQRKGRKGAFWEDRYHATAVAADHHLARCLTYIDMNMVRAGVVKDPEEWQECGLAELSEGRQRYLILDASALVELLGMPCREKLLKARRDWIQAAIVEGIGSREVAWSESLAVGDPAFVTGVKLALGHRGKGRKVQETTQGFILRESEAEYGILPVKT